MHIEDVLSMPDKWEYPFFAIWDSVSRLPFDHAALTSESRRSTVSRSR